MGKVVTGQPRPWLVAMLTSPRQGETGRVADMPDIDGVGFYEADATLFYYDERGQSWCCRLDGENVEPPFKIGFVPADAVEVTGSSLALYRANFLDAIAREDPVEVSPAHEWVTIHTDAPAAFDGFSTVTVKEVGRSRSGQYVREVKTKRCDYLWQTGRYASSGMVKFTEDPVSECSFVQWGHWVLGPV
jgi:hypothetical protein